MTILRARLVVPPLAAALLGVAAATSGRTALGQPTAS
jgi:hypothetical protein